MQSMTFRFALAIGCLLLGTGARASDEAPVYDLLIRGARVLDGTGTPWYYADVAVTGDRIVAVGKLPANAASKRTFEANGQYLAPGFIDPHSHAWPAIGEEALASAEPLLTQGITTVVLNPDGTGPVDLATQQLRIEQARPGVNVALLVPHNSIRIQVLGYQNRAPTAEELVRMQSLVREGMEAGALGLSAGPFYPPGNFSKTDEHIALARVAAQFDGIYTSHIRDESRYNIGLIAAVDEVIQVAREARLPGIVTHIKASTRACWGMSAEVIRIINAARAEGVEVFADQYPYDASGTSLSAAVIPGWAMEGGESKLRQRLKDRALRAKIRASVAENLENRGGAESILISSNRADKRLEGLRLDAIAKQRKADAVDVAIELIARGSPTIFSFNMNETDVRAFMAQPWTMTSTDGSLLSEDNGMPHPRAYGTFPKKLRRYAIDDPVLTLEQAVHSMTGLTASIMRLRDRGVIRVGARADLVVFDPKTLRDNATYENPRQLSTGVTFVVVNGVVAVSEGRVTQERGGRVLSRARE
ncbi:aminoacylase [Steroidobacter agaridevorans]|nr:aminoacylase [Steroidobacter agaridevorans]